MYMYAHLLLSCDDFRYRRQFKSTRLRRPSKPRYSRDQGFFDADDDEETDSIVSVPVTLRPKYSRKSSRVSL